MKPEYFILNNQNVIGKVYKKDNNKIIFMNDSVINLEFGFTFLESSGMRVEDQVVRDILSDFMFQKRMSNVGL
jgi:hypothetical protein